MIYTDSFRRISPVYNYSTYTIQNMEQYLSETGISDVLEDENQSVLLPQKQLVHATFASDITAIEELLNSGVSIEIAEFNKELLYKSKYYLTPLQIAVARGDKETLEFLIKHGANVNCKDRFDVFPIHMAAEQGYHDCLRLLLKAGAKCCGLSYYCDSHVNPAPFYIGTTPLHIAVSNFAVSKDHALCIKELLENFSDCNAVDELGRNVLSIASELEDEDLILMLLRNTTGIERKFFSMPDKSGDTPLHFAVERGMMGLITKLLQLGSDINSKNKIGLSPMDICIKSLYSSDPKFEILKLFVLHGYNFHIAQGRPTLLQRLFNNNFIDPSREFTKFLIAFGADTDLQNMDKVDLLEAEFKNFESNPTILTAILDTKRFPPSMARFFLLSRLQRHLMPKGRGKGKNKKLPPCQKLTPSERRKIRMLNWYESAYPQLPSLQHLCRSSIRTTLIARRRLNNKVKDLRIPNKILSYILLGVQI